MDKIDLSLNEEEFDRRLKILNDEQERKRAFFPLIATAWFDGSENMIKLKLTNGMTIGFPPDLGQETIHFDENTLSQVKVGPGGYSIIWEEPGAGIELSSILAGRFGSRKWMEKLHKDRGIPLGMWSDSEDVRSECARVVGSVTSKAKAAAARENGKRGGRPPKGAVPVVISNRGNDKTVIVSIGEAAVTAVVKSHQNSDSIKTPFGHPVIKALGKQLKSSQNNRLDNPAKNYTSSQHKKPKPNTHGQRKKRNLKG